MDRINTQKLKRFAIALVIAVLLKNTAHAQMALKIDKAPMDIAYYRTSKIAAPLVKVIYGRPSKTQGKVFGEQVPFDKIWKTGANEITEIKFFKDVTIGNTKVSAGTYALYTKPGKDEWEIIINSNIDLWGSSEYDPMFDIVRISVPVKKAESVAVFSIWFAPKNTQVEMNLSWGATRITVPFSLEIENNYEFF